MSDTFIPTNPFDADRERIAYLEGRVENLQRCNDNQVTIINDLQTTVDADTAMLDAHRARIDSLLSEVCDRQTTHEGQGRLIAEQTEKINNCGITVECLQQEIEKLRQLHDEGRRILRAVLKDVREHLVDGEYESDHPFVESMVEKYGMGPLTYNYCETFTVTVTVDVDMELDSEDSLSKVQDKLRRHLADEIGEYSGGFRHDSIVGDFDLTVSDATVR